MINKIQKITLLIIVSSVLCCNSLFARAMVLPLEKMTKESDLILIGKVTAIIDNSWISKEKVGTAQGWITESIAGSTAEIELEKVINGSLKKIKENKIFVRYRGTAENDVEDEPRFEFGKKILLFLKRINDNYYETVGRFSGKVEIINNTVYVYEGGKDNWSGHGSFKWDGKTYYSKQLTIDECIEEIKKYMSLEGKNEKK